jgi:hypothetical protein
LKHKLNIIFDWRVKLKKEINLSKEQKNQKNDYQNWNKKYKQFFYWMVKLKRKNNLTKCQKSKEWGLKLKYQQQKGLTD